MNTDQNGITVGPGHDLGDELYACIEIIKEGGAVNVATATEELPEALFVAVKRAAGSIVGVGAIKKQRPWYARDIADKSGHKFDENLHELGYFAVHANHRKQGIARQLLLHLISLGRPRPLFATTSSTTMKKLLSEVGFKQHGKQWKNSTLSLWIKE